MPSANLSMNGGDGILTKLARAAQGGRAGAFRGLVLGGHHVLQLSNAKVPHEEGDLERDGAVVEDEGNMEVAVTYGRDANVADYAVRQHEDLSLKHDAGREAKFLENARNSSRDTVLALIAEQARQGMES